MRTFQPVMFKCAGCHQEADCGPHTSVTSYEIFGFRKRLHKDCPDLKKKLKALSDKAFAAYTKEKKERPDMKYSIGWKCGYHRAIFSAYLITKFKISLLEKNLAVRLRQQQQKWKQNQRTKNPKNAMPSTEHDGKIDGTMCGLKEAIKLLERFSPKSCIDVSIC